MSESDRALDMYLDRFARDALADALAQATPAFWRRRAEVFDAAAPQPGEYRGRATDDELREAWRRCRATAEACRRRADLLVAEPEVPAEILVEAEAVLRAVVQVRSAQAVAA